MRIDLGRVAQVAANIGVIAGIIFLGMELRQNNDLLDSQARQSRANGERALSEAIYNDATGLARLFGKAASGVELTPDEEFRLDRYLTTVIRDWEFWYLDFTDGILNVAELRSEGWRRQFHSVLPSRMAEIWERERLTSDQAFVEFMEANVVNR